MNGVVYVAYGDGARREFLASVGSLWKHNPLPVAVIGDKPISGKAGFIPFDEPGPGARWAKLNLNNLIPFDNALYLDADTRIHGDIGAGFQLLADGWDMVIAPSSQQNGDLMHHVSEAERRATYEAVANPLPLALQAGVFFFNKKRTARLFELWREEWSIWKDQDQGALLRALARCPLRLCLLGRDWNGGELVEHLFGRARL